ncbi:P pilus assembly protein, pilin FimA [Serratia quinivorans]|uniref:fimbrial protein n=1 Tax=Serratia quinivorans TaxID=137545 RepID=UPI002178CD3F|nr:fimbrial protein [Serratia quinivorans]CAI1604379.1 P pilus assembly protein, pilin FimA [Serratia quinivorans]
MFKFSRNRYLCLVAYCWLGVASADSVTINLSGSVTIDSCKVTSPTSQSLSWGALPASTITAGAAAVKKATVSIDCGTYSLPVTTKLTNSTGDQDATKGILNSGLTGLGLKATWVDDGSIVVLSQSKSWASQSGVRDFSINFQPIKVGEVTPGNFSTVGTLSIEYR